jgi:hypothetical protein
MKKEYLHLADPPCRIRTKQRSCYHKQQRPVDENSKNKAWLVSCHGCTCNTDIEAKGVTKENGI